MDKITVVCHKDHDKGYEDYVGKCLLCEVERLRKHEWVGLTEDRVDYLADKYAPPIDPAFTKDDDYWRFYQEIEAELKEKNHGLL